MEAEGEIGFWLISARKWFKGPIKQIRGGGVFFDMLEYQLTIYLQLRRLGSMSWPVKESTNRQLRSTTNKLSLSYCRCYFILLDYYELNPLTDY